MVTNASKVKLAKQKSTSTKLESNSNSKVKTANKSLNTNTKTNATNANVKPKTKAKQALNSVPKQNQNQNQNSKGGNTTPNAKPKGNTNVNANANANPKLKSKPKPNMNSNSNKKEAASTNKSKRNVHKKTGKIGKTATAYLIAYNFIQVIGWTYIMYLLLSHYAKPKEQQRTLYESLKWPVIIFQNLAILEVFHSLAKLVPSSAVITLAQVYSRVIVVAGVIIATPDAKLSIGLPICVAAWSISEVIRYLYYAWNLIGKAPAFITWLRYSLFYVMYPIGISGELLCFYAAQNYAANVDSWSANVYGLQLTYRHFLIASMLVYVPIFPKLFGHMMSQRRKVLKTGQKLKKK